LHLETGDLDASKNQKNVLVEEWKDISEKLDNINDEIMEKTRELANFKIKKQDLRSRINQLRNPVLVAELNAFEDKNSQLRERLIQLDSEVKGVDTQISMVLPDESKIKGVLGNNKKEIEKFDNVIKDLSQKIVDKNKELVVKEENERQFYSKFKKLFNDRSALNVEIQKLENSIDSLRDVSRSTEIKMNTGSLENAKISAELAALLQEFQQYEGVPLNKEKDEEQLKREIHRFEIMVEQVGSVNMRALEIYDAVEKEYNSLLEKKDKLSLEKNDVLSMINEIEGKKKELFINSLKSVEANFKTIFSEMSTKGEASLELENEENPFEGGLLIKVRLSGTKFLDIRSLSGGEKTLTALSFIFAIQECDPHSFYILDEVDAALDKHNSEKLGKVIRKYCVKAQYVVISHNDSIISEADNLYGVSMNEFGISNVTSLKI
jgi:chromosome segregation protein